METKYLYIDSCLVKKEKFSWQHYKNCSGFTLLEMVISVTLSSVVLLTIYATYFGINRSIEIASEEKYVLETGRILIEIIKRDIRGIRSIEKFALISKIEEMEERTVSKMDFITTSSMGWNAFGLSEVGYCLVEIKDNEKVFLRRESKEVKDDPAEGGSSFELSKMVISFKSSFYDGINWVDKWDSNATGKLPKQVRITIVVSDGKGITKEFTTDEAIPSAL